MNKKYKIMYDKDNKAYFKFNKHTIYLRDCLFDRDNKILYIDYVGRYKTDIIHDMNDYIILSEVKENE